MQQPGTINDISLLRSRAREHNASIEEFVSIVQDVVVDPMAKCDMIFTARCFNDTPEMLMLDINLEKGTATRRLVSPQKVPPNSEFYLELVPEGKLIDFFLDFKGY